MAQDAKIIVAPSVPDFLPAYGLTELVRRIPITVKSDRVEVTDTTAVNLIELPPNALITDVKVSVTEAFDASGTSAAATATVTIPQDTGPLVVWDAANTALQAVGIYSASGMGLASASGGYLALNLTAGTSANGALEVYLSYIPNRDRL